MNFDPIKDDRNKNTDSNLIHLQGIDDSSIKVNHLIILYTNLIEILRCVNQQIGVLSRTIIVKVKGLILTPKDTHHIPWKLQTDSHH